MRVRALQDVGGNWQRLLSGVTHDVAKATEKKNDQEMLLGYHLIAEMTVKRVDSRKVIDDSGVLGAKPSVRLPLGTTNAFGGVSVCNSRNKSRT